MSPRRYMKPSRQESSELRTWYLKKTSSVLLLLKMTLEQAVQILQNSIAEHFIDIKPQSQPALQKEEWKELVGRLEDEEKVFILPPVSGQRNAVTVVGFKTSLTPVATKLTDFIKLHTVVDDVIRMESGRVRFLFDLKKDELQMVRQQAKQQPFSIDRYQNSTGIIVKGTEDDVRAACEQLKKLAEKVSARPHPIDKPGMPALFKEDKGQMYLRVVESEFNCRIDVTDPSEVETAMEVEAEEEVPMMPPPTTLTVLCYVTRKDGRRIVVGKGDLTKMPVDAIVNGSTQQLDHSGGLAKAIVDAGGQSIADETTRLLRMREGRLFPGQVVSTASGTLPCKRVIHAVGPSWNKGYAARKSYSKEISQEEKMLHDTVCNSLFEAERCHCRSVALPAISSGAFGFPLEICVDTIVNAVDEFYRSRPLGGLMEVNLVDNADRTCKSFQDSLVKYYGNEEVIIPDKFSGSVGSTNSNRGRGTTRMTEEGSRDTSLEPLSNSTELRTSSGVLIKLVKGSIAKQKTDIIVNTTQTSLSLNTGGVSAAIVKVAGPVLQKEVDAYKNAGWPVKEGVLIETNGAKLKCKKVYHVLCCHYDGGPNSERTLRDLMRQCFQRADQAGMLSISFPAIGTGGLGFPSDFTAKVMYEEARKFSASSPNSSLKEIRFVIYEKDHQTHQAFKDVIQQLTKRRHSGKVTPKKKSDGFQQPPPQSVQASYSSHSGAGGNEIEDSPYKNLQQTPKGSQMMIGNIIVQVEAGDITQERTDAIVNSTNGSLDLSQGGVSKAILAAGGRDIVKECNSLGVQQPDDVVMTGAGNLQCNNIIHMITPYQKLDDSITRMMMFAESKQVKSLAMPAIGTGALGKDPSTVAQQTLKAIDDFYQQRNTQCLKLIRVVLFQRPMVQTFHQAMVSLLGKPATDRRGYVQKARDLVGGLASSLKSLVTASPGEPVRKRNTLLLYIFADKRKDIDGAVEKLESFMDTEFIDMNVSKENVGKISDEELYQVKITAERLEVKVDKIPTGSVTHLRLQGRVQTVFKVQEEINKILDRIAEEERRKNEARLLAKNVKWMYLSDGEQFDEYDDEIIGIIEQARVENRRDVEFEIQDGKYRIDFRTMKEIDLDDMSTVPVRRELREAGVPLPSNWVDMTQHGNFRKETLDPKTTEYQGVEQAFKQTLQPGYNLTKIVRIERLQNIQQYRQYVILKQTLDAKNRKGTKNEKTLYHGTSADSVDKISKKGFNRSFAGKNATLYGAGTYFAVNSELSARSIYSPPDANGYKYIYQAKVLTGEYTVGSQNMLVPPSKNPNDPTDCYDSVVDNMQNPEIFVVFNDAVAYPEYLIVFY
ncbi:protein mono-ADP-ribosyltransferase PARP14-like isoform X2 [Ptychodera flava]|uniref:protein mono-ADP-ribosyltransferase PARP14-like isoform X2 n=1 Tax=Ptychodera flava TaxID=63121 RepID=UPI00396A8E48